MSVVKQVGIRKVNTSGNQGAIATHLLRFTAEGQGNIPLGMIYRKKISKKFSG
jgi:hypothetical protein